MTFRKKLLLFFVLLLALPAAAQFNFYVEGAGNLSVISGSKATSTFEITSDNPDYSLFQKEMYKAKYKSGLGGGVVVGVNYFLADNFSLDAGFDFTTASFHQLLTKSTEYSYVSKTNSSQTLPAPPSSSQSMQADNYNMLLLSLPISISYYLVENNLAVGVGVLPGLLLHSSGGMDAASSNLNKTAFGIQIQLRYQVVPQLWLVAGLKEYSTKLYEPKLKQSFSSLRLLKIGLRYDI